MSTILVAGVNGFVGHHLTRELATQGHEVIGVGREAEPTSNIREAVSDYFVCDTTDYDSVSKLPLNEVAAIINLAGLAAVGKSFDEPDVYMRVNVSVLTTFCRRIRDMNRKDLRMIAISSGGVYASGQPMPLTEDSAVDASSSPYAASKLAMEQAAREFRNNGFDCVIARPFNHIGPGQAPGFLLPDLYAKIKEVKGSEIRVGNLETRRDYTDVRDVARAYLALATQDKLSHAVYNVCSGLAIGGATVLDALKEACNLPDLQYTIDKEQFRPSDSPVLYGNNSRIKNETGWQPRIPLTQTVQDFVAAD